MATSRIPLGRASLLASSAIREAARVGIPAQSVTPVGGVRRFAPDVADTALLAAFAATHQADVLERFSGLPMVTSILERHASVVRLDTVRGALSVYVANPETVGAAMVWHTGSRRHTAALAERAARRDLVFADGELRRRNGSTVIVATEEEVYRLLDLPLIPPELREEGGEIAAAEHGRLPCLVSTAHMRGDLHMHTTWSDGRDSVETMALAAQALGYEYVAITDHSERAWSSRRLAAADIPRQREEIEAVRQAVSGLTILHGVEVDIMPDGSLDFDDDVLAGFDIVLASLHDNAGHTRDELTERYLAAIRHPLVNVITHPANRSPALSDGYDVDFDRVIAAASETGTALEIDGAPGHLDMDGALARRAAQAGVTVTIDSDCHRSDALARQMRYGVGTARRGWIEPHHVLNARSVEDVRRFVDDKRAGR